MNLPSSPESELGIIGCILTGGIDSAIEAMDSINSEMFLDTDCQTAFNVASGMASRGERIDSVTFFHQWNEDHGDHHIPTKLLSAPDTIPSAANLPLYMTDVRDAFHRRHIILELDRVMTAAQDPLTPLETTLSEAQEALFGREIRNVRNVSSKAAAGLLTTDLEARFERKGALTGISTGFPYLDHLTDGLQAGELFVIGARPSAGKTAIAGNIIAKACLEGKVPSLFITLEMSPTAICRRLLSGVMSISMKTIKNGRFSDVDFYRMGQFTVRLAQSPLYFLDAVGGIDCASIASAVVRHQRKHGIKLVVIDYLQKVSAIKKQEKRTYEVGEVSTSLKACAAANNIAFLALAQLSREPEKDKGRMPRLSDLADSSQLERDADTVGLMHRVKTDDDPHASKTTLFIAKQRDGETGNVQLFFDGQYCRFSTIDPNTPEPETRYADQ
jgi:replicative DNA helicase